MNFHKLSSAYRSKDEHIDLIPVEEFYESAPETITRPVNTIVFQLRRVS